MVQRNYRRGRLAMRALGKQQAVKHQAGATDFEGGGDVDELHATTV